MAEAGDPDCVSHVGYLITEEFHEGLSKLVAELMTQSPPGMRNDMLSEMQDRSCVYDTDYKKYTTY